MITFIIVAFVQLGALLAGWWLTDRLGAGQLLLPALYLAVAPFIPSAPVRRSSFETARAPRITAYVIGAMVGVATVAIALEWRSQLVRLAIPIQVQDPLRVTLGFLSYVGLLIGLGLAQVRLQRPRRRRVLALPRPLLALPDPLGRQPEDRFEHARTAVSAGGGLLSRGADSLAVVIQSDEPEPSYPPPQAPPPTSDIDATAAPEPIETAPIRPTRPPHLADAILIDTPVVAPRPPATESPEADTADAFDPGAAPLPELLATADGLERDLSPAQVAESVLRALQTHLPIETAAVLRHQRRHGLYRTVAVCGPHGALVSDFEAPAAGLLARLLTQGRPVTSTQREEIVQTGLPARFERAELLPLIVVNGEIQKVLLLLDADLSGAQRGALHCYCRYFSALQENTRLRADRNALANDLSVLLEIAKTIGSVDDVDELFGTILEKSTAFLRAEQGSLMLLDEQRRELGVRAMKGLNKKIAGLLRIRPGEGIAGKVLATGSPLLVSDIENDDRITQERRARYRTKSFVSVPLKLEGRTIGVLNVADKISGDAFSDQDLHLLTSIGAYASVAIERSRFHLKTEELKKISITDPLTGLLNRRYFQERMSEEIERSRRHRLPLSLIMIDLDDFKSINDGLGHMAGDEVLQCVARCIRNSIRAIDVAARYGGEEFTVILPQTAKADAISLAERICGEVARLELPYERKGRRLALTVSLGLATYPEDAGSLEDLIRNSDSALYTAKAHGKNRVVVFRTPPK